MLVLRRRVILLDPKRLPRWLDTFARHRRCSAS